MLRRVPLLAVAFLACIGPATGLAQDEPAGGEEAGADWIRLESAQSGRTYAEQTEVHIIHARATSSDRAMQMQALARVRSLVEANNPVSRFPEVTEIVSILALGPYRVERYGGDQAGLPSSTGNPVVRLGALELLGRIGGQEAYDVVVESLHVERDPSVRAAALRVLPQLGVRPGAELPGTMARIMARSSGDAATLGAALAAVRTLHARYGFMDTPRLFTAVIDVAQGPYTATLRRKAFEVVELLRE